MRELVAYRRQLTDVRDRDMALAWHIAKLSRVDKMPPLRDLLNAKSGPRRQHPAEQAAIWQVAAARFGGTFRPMDPADYAKVIRG
ncbi:MAG: hypothetical protein AB7R67_18910 [Vicinamibacterales bacterium]